MPKKVIIIGSGSAGLVCAIGLSKLGYDTTIVEKHLIGGDCTNYGCIPSKSILFRAKKFAQFKKELLKSTDELLTSQNLEMVLEKKAQEALEQTREVVREFQKEESREWLEKNGVKFAKGTARFLNKNEIEVTGEIEGSSDSVLENYKTEDGKLKIPFEKAIIASGSRPRIPNIEGLIDTPYLNNESIFDLQEVPKRLVVIGNGPIGIELSQAFNNLGSKVTVVGRSQQILNKSDKESSDLLQTKLEKEGLDFLSEKAKKVKYENNLFSLELEDGQILEAEKLLVATGRVSNVDLDLEKAGVNYDPKGIKVNKFCRTSNPNIYAAGDCTALPKFTHFAGHMAKQVVTNFVIQKYLKLPIHIAKYSDDLVPAVTYTSPELATAGLTEEKAKKKFGENKVRSFKLDFKDLDRAKVQNEEGFIKLVTTGFWGRIVGVHIVGERAGDILPDFQQMIATKKTMRFLSKIIRAYPTYTDRIDKLFWEWIYGKVGR